MDCFRPLKAEKRSGTEAFAFLLFRFRKLPHLRLLTTERRWERPVGIWQGSGDRRRVVTTAAAVQVRQDVRVFGVSALPGHTIPRRVTPLQASL